MDSVIELKAEVEEIRNLLNTAITDKGSSDCTYLLTAIDKTNKKKMGNLH